MRRANVYYGDELAGILTESNDGDYLFEYTDDYIANFPKQCITLTLPVSKRTYKDNRLFPFFEGLIPEGWLLDVAYKNWKINPNDRMGLLLTCCENCIGAVSVKRIEDE